MTSRAYEFIYKIVRRIPRGRVATYGQIAELAGIEGHARRVGYALHALRGESDVPWHRVVNARGSVSLPRGSEGHDLQRILLEAEGVEFTPAGAIPLLRYRWVSPVRRATRITGSRRGSVLPSPRGGRSTRS